VIKLYEISVEKFTYIKRALVLKKIIDVKFENRTLSHTILPNAVRSACGRQVRDP
jgi:hypothetical protein